MGRIRANPVSSQPHQFHVQPQNDQHQLQQPHQQHTFQVESCHDHQGPRANDEILPPPTEPYHEDLYPEDQSHQYETSPFASQEPTSQSKPQANQETLQPHQQYTYHDHQGHQANDEILHEDLYPESNQYETSPLASQVPKLQSKLQANQESLQPMPPPNSPLQPTPVLFPQPITRPVSQSLPQPFPPARDYYSLHAFPPTWEENQDFPPTPTKAQAFPPPQGDQPQFFPQAFVPQNHNLQPQAGTIFSQPNGPQLPNAANGFGPQGMPPASPMPQTPITGIPAKPLLPTETWKTGLFGCMEDPTNALITACFPCLTFGQIAEIVDSGQTTCATSGLIYGAIAFCVAMPCIMSCTYRTKLRSRYGLIESPAPDWVIHCFCECCALCQEYRELHLRGIDPSIGWQGNQAWKQHMQLKQSTMVPPVHQTMG